jgi:hypothetical protein
MLVWRVALGQDRIGKGEIVRFGGRKLLFKLILVGLLTGGAGISGCRDEGRQYDLATLWQQEPVLSDWAARIDLFRYGQSLDQVTGLVRIAPELRSLVIDLPRISVAWAETTNLESLTISEVTKAGDCFTFHGSWPAGTADALGVSYTSEMLTLRADILVACDQGVGGGDKCDTDLGWENDCSGFCGPDTVKMSTQLPQPEEGVAAKKDSVCAQGDQAAAARVVRSETNAGICRDCAGEKQWAAYDADCYYCYSIAEMAPSPIPPAIRNDDLPLPGAFNLSLVQVWGNGRELSLLAEHDAPGQVSYEWHVSSGALSEEDQGGVVWIPPREPGPHVIQVAVHNETAAAVASLRWGGAAARG